MVSIHREGLLKDKSDEILFLFTRMFSAASDYFPEMHERFILCDSNDKVWRVLDFEIGKGIFKMKSILRVIDEGGHNKEYEISDIFDPQKTFDSIAKRLIDTCSKYTHLPTPKEYWGPIEDWQIEICTSIALQHGFGYP
jgi:hypothetical protein